MRRTVFALLASIFVSAIPAYPAPLAFITNAGSGTVSVIDTETNSVTATLGVGQNPVGVAVSPDGRAVYVTNLSSGTVSVIDAAALSVARTYTAGASPFGIAVSPDDRYLYVANDDSFLRVLDALSGDTVATVPVGPDPEGVAVPSGSGFIYVADHFSGSVTVIDPDGFSVAAVITVGSGPAGVTASPGAKGSTRSTRDPTTSR